jgi:protein-S-isoprenylcysteine O-methyltransferase Ste14
LITSMIIGPPAVVLVWMAVRHLDKQWRFEAALSEDHKLITTGPYRWLRNPIYASMLGMLLQTGLAKSWWPLIVAGAVFFVIGTEIRVRAEEMLLEKRFGEEFARYKAQTPAYLPFLR